MKKIIIVSSIFIVLFGCRKPVDTIGENTCDILQVENCECFNGVWNLTSITSDDFVQPISFEIGENIWEFNNQDSTISISNETNLGLLGGQYQFSIDNLNILRISDSQNVDVLSPTDFYNFEDSILNIDFGFVGGSGLYIFKRTP